MISESGAKYLFVIMNTDRSDKKGIHWWIVCIASKKGNFYV